MTGGNLQPPSGGPMVWRHQGRWEPYRPITTNFPHAPTQTRRGDARKTKFQTTATQQSIKRANPLMLQSRDPCKTTASPPPTREMSEGHQLAPASGGNAVRQRGPLPDDQANNATDKSFAKVSFMGRLLRKQGRGACQPNRTY